MPLSYCRSTHPAVSCMANTDDVQRVVLATRVVSRHRVLPLSYYCRSTHTTVSCMENNDDVRRVVPATRVFHCIVFCHGRSHGISSHGISHGFHGIAHGIHIFPREALMEAHGTFQGMLYSYYYCVLPWKSLPTSHRNRTPHGICCINSILLRLHRSLKVRLLD